VKQPGDGDPSARRADSVPLLPATLAVANISPALEAATPNHELQITIAHLGTVSIDDVTVEYSAAAVSRQVGAHVHMLSPETYLVLHGHGLIHIGEVDLRGGNPVAAWQKPMGVSQNDMFTIPAGYAHSLENLGTEPLVIVFFGSPRNLTTDRLIVRNPVNQPDGT
jgi:mannose-6-phosphate isomerase-like protein (cupin superfamily)